MRKLEELFDLPSVSDDSNPRELIHVDQEHLAELDDIIDRIDSALPTVRDLATSDSELDTISTEAMDSFETLMNLGMNVDSRYASEIFSVASTMLGHALSAKTAKINKKLKVVDLQLKKAKLDFDKLRHESKDSENTPIETAEGQILTRNDLLSRILNNNNDNTNS